MPDHGERHRGVVGGRVVVERGENARPGCRAASARRKAIVPSSRVTGKPWPISSVTVKSLYLNDGPKSPCPQRAQIAGVLHPDGLIQAVGALQIGHDFRRQRLLPVEWTAGRRANREKKSA